MALPVIHQTTQSRMGINFRAVDVVPQFPMGTAARDQYGQVYRYVKVATDLSIGDADVDGLIVHFTWTLDLGTNGAITAAVDGDGSVVGAPTTVVAAAVGAGESIDGVLERRASGTGVQIDGSPTPKYVWIKVKGIANRLLKAAALDAGQYADRIADGSGLLVEETAAGASLGNRFGRCLAEHTTTAGAGLAGDFAFDVEF